MVETPIFFIRQRQKKAVRKLAAILKGCDRIAGNEKENEQIRARADREHAAGGKARRRAQGARHPRDEGRDTGCEGDPAELAHVATSLRGGVPHSAADAQELGARSAASRCAGGGLSARDQAAAERSHG